jgi:hypothetical protein
LCWTGRHKNLLVLASSKTNNHCRVASAVLCPVGTRRWAPSVCAAPPTPIILLGPRPASSPLCVPLPALPLSFYRQVKCLFHRSIQGTFFILRVKEVGTTQKGASREWEENCHFLRGHRHCAREHFWPSQKRCPAWFPSRLYTCKFYVLYIIRTTHPCFFKQAVDTAPPHRVISPWGTVKPGAYHGVKAF